MVQINKKKQKKHNMIYTRPQLFMPPTRGFTENYTERKEKKDHQKIL